MMPIRQDTEKTLVNFFMAFSPAQRKVLEAQIRVCLVAFSDFRESISQFGMEVDRQRFCGEFTIPNTVWDYVLLMDYVEGVGFFYGREASVARIRGNQRKLETFNRIAASAAVFVAAVINRVLMESHFFSGVNN